MWRRILILAALPFAGCVARPVHRVPTELRPAPATTAPVVSLVWDEQLEARICPPPGWRLDPPKSTSQHLHKTWLSPTGDTAYGVIRFRLPIPVTEELALWGFMREMRRSEGDGTLLEKQPDPTLADGAGGLRFVAEGGRYKVRTNLVVRGFRGWCIYAGTLRGRSDNPPELADAIAAREATRVGPPPATRAAQP